MQIGAIPQPMRCHCGEFALDHWNEKGLEDLRKVHLTRCCNCADSYAFKEDVASQSWFCKECGA